MKLDKDEKYGIVVGLISANIFGFLTKGTFGALLEMEASLNFWFISQMLICYTFFVITISSLATPVLAFREAIRRKSDVRTRV